MAALNQSYWILGGLLGNLVGAALGMDATGVDFAMTALFIVIALGQWRGSQDHLPALLGLGATLASRVLLGAGNNMLLPALGLIVAVLALRKPRMKEALSHV